MRTEFLAFGDDIINSTRGLQTTDMWLNEADTNPVLMLTQGITRLNRWPGHQHFVGYGPEHQTYAQLICDFNAPDEDNWTFKVFHDEEERAKVLAGMAEHQEPGARPFRLEFHNQPGYGQPGCENLHNLSPSYYPRQIATMKLAGRGDMLDRMVFNKVVYQRAGEPVFQREFNRRIHVSPDPIAPEAGLPLEVGLDQGFKGAAVIGQFLEPGHWRILGELHFPKERLMAAEFGRRLAEMIERRWPGHLVEAAYGDMAGEHGASQAADENATWNRLVGKAAGFRVRPQRIGTNRIQPRLEAVRAALEFMHAGRPGLEIDPSAKFLIRGFEARYVWAEEVDHTGDKRKVPDKRLTEANVMDALQYLTLSRHRANGLSAISFPRELRAETSPDGAWRPGREKAAGLNTGYDPLNPYGE